MMDLIIDHVLMFYVNGMGKLDANAKLKDGEVYFSDCYALVLMAHSSIKQ
jgi:hypothetical protein